MYIGPLLNTVHDVSILEVCVNNDATLSAPPVNNVIFCLIFPAARGFPSSPVDDPSKLSGLIPGPYCLGSMFTDYYLIRACHRFSLSIV